MMLSEQHITDGKENAVAEFMKQALGKAGKLQHNCINYINDAFDNWKQCPIRHTDNAFLLRDMQFC